MLESGQLVQGEQVERFESAAAALVGRKHAVAVSSGTAALQLALEAIGVGARDEVICPALTWPSPAHAARLTGARVRFADVDAEEWNTAPDAFANARTEATKAAIVIDQFGNPARAAAIRDALGALPIIEDAACAIGSRFSDGPCGSLGAVSCFSFHPRKILTTGEGGMCLTDDDDIAQRLRVLRDHGRLGATFVVPGGNFRMTDIAAALGLAQLQRLDQIVTRRREIAAMYRNALSERVDFQACPEGAESNYQTLGVILPHSVDRDLFRTSLQQHGVEAGLLSYAAHKQGSFAGNDSSLPVAEHLANQGIALPLFPQMRNTEVEEVVLRVGQVLDG